MIELKLDTHEPDSIGFSKVSGFYGPGSWAGWFCCICASWYTLLVHNGRGFDPNTWLYLAGMNWAAVDYIETLRIMRILRKAGSETWMQESASLGASFNLLYWGLMHSCFQLGCCAKAMNNGRFDRPREIQRGLSLIAGSLLPAAAMASTPFLDAWGAEMKLFRNVPALYWEGELEKDGKKRWRFGEDDTTTLAGLFGLWIFAYLAALLWFPFYRTDVFIILERWVAYALAPIRWIVRRFHGVCKVLLPLMIYGLYGILLVNLRASSIWYLLPCWLFPLPTAFFVIPLGLIIQILICVIYVLVAYSRDDTSWSRVCYFMPCAPQSIKERDQAFSLFAGIFSFVVVEVMVPFIRRNYIERNEQRLQSYDTEEGP